MPVGTEDVEGAELLPSPAAPVPEEAGSGESPLLEEQAARIGAIAARPARAGWSVGCNDDCRAMSCA